MATPKGPISQPNRTRTIPPPLPLNSRNSPTGMEIPKATFCPPEVSGEVNARRSQNPHGRHDESLLPGKIVLVIVEGCYRPPVFDNRRFWCSEVGANAAVAADLAFCERHHVRAVQTARRPLTTPSASHPSATRSTSGFRDAVSGTAIARSHGASASGTGRIPSASFVPSEFL